MTKTAIKITNLSKQYKNGHVALDDVSLDIPEGSFFGLLGPNGAGKSTLINILAGMVNKTSGDISVFGNSVADNLQQVKFDVGIVPQEVVLDPFFNVHEMLEYHAGYYGIPKNKRKTDELIAAMHLQDKAQTKSRKLSGGMKRRVLIAKALVHSPKIVVLDEPTAGVDVELRNLLWEYVSDLNKQGITVLLTTHYLEEAEKLCDQIAVIDKGKIIANDSKANLLSKMDKKCLIITVDGKAQEIENFNRVEQHLNDNKLIINYPPSVINAGEIIQRINESGATILDITSKETNLEDIFTELVS